MNVVIVEDEKVASEHLAELIVQHDPSVNICQFLDSVEDSIDYFSSNPEINLAFMDIRLADGMSFEIFSESSVNCPVIFTTAYDEYALKAFKVNSIDYLLKPISKPDLEQALKKFKKFSGSFSMPDKVSIAALMQEINGGRNNYKKRFLVRFGNHLQYKTPGQVAYFYADGKDVFLVERETSKRYVIDETMEFLESNLLDPEHFFRINRSFIINVESIKDIRSFMNSRLKILSEVQTEKDMVVSRGKVPAFKQWLNQ